MRGSGGSERFRRRRRDSPARVARTTPSAAELNLTEAQRTRIQAIHQKYLPQLRTLQDQGTTQMRAMRDARQKGDTSAAARQRFQQQREQFRQRVTSLRQQEQNEVRGVLTAEQTAKWDAAAKQRKERVEGRRERMKQRRGARTGATVAVWLSWSRSPTFAHRSQRSTHTRGQLHAYQGRKALLHQPSR